MRLRAISHRVTPLNKRSLFGNRAARVSLKPTRSSKTLMRAMTPMKKIDIASIEAARRGLTCAASWLGVLDTRNRTPIGSVVKGFTAGWRAGEADCWMIVIGWTVLDGPNDAASRQDQPH
jgi:hypothetical protein